VPPFPISPEGSSTRIDVRDETDKTESNEALKPWERQPNESPQAYEAAFAYFEMGADRSVRAVGRRLRKSGSVISKWSARWHWVERAAAYDRSLTAVAVDAAAAERAREAAKWERRRAKTREQDWKLAKALRAKAKAILASEDAKFTLRDAVAMADTGSKLARLAGEMATSREHVEIDFEGMSDDELLKIANGEG
jgi:hypothetical protein